MAVVVLGVLLALTALGVYGMAIATLVGAMGLAISLSLQDVARNLVAGFYLRLEHQFGPGDRIILKGETGEIAFVGLRTTLLRRALRSPPP